VKSNVTTGKGDSGQTRALDGTQFEKCHPMMEALGTLDTLRTHTALLRLQLQEKYPEETRQIKFLLFLLHTYFLIGTTISDPQMRKPEWHRGEITTKHLQRLESEQQHLEEDLTLPHSFIVSATNPIAAQADITASTARAFERRFVAFCQSTPEFQHPTCLAYINRISDYFFILARQLEKGLHQPVDYSTLEHD